MVIDCLITAGYIAWGVAALVVIVCIFIDEEGEGKNDTRTITTTNPDETGTLNESYDVEQAD